MAKVILEGLTVESLSDIIRETVQQEAAQKELSATKSDINKENFKKLCCRCWL